MALTPSSTGGSRSNWLALILVVPLIAVIVQWCWVLISVSINESSNQRASNLGSGQMFDSIAQRYDMVNRVMAMGLDIGWRKQLVEVIQSSLHHLTTTEGTLQRTKPRKKNSPRILDIATGTADVAIMLAQAIPSATIIGVDPSANMLDIGRKKVNHGQQHSAVSLQLGDATDLSRYAASSFDAATMAFGIRNVPDRARALCQIHRILRKNSTLGILELSTPQSAGLMSVITRTFIQHIVPLVGGILSGAPREYLYLQKSIHHFPNPVQFGQFMENLKCGRQQKQRSGSYEVQEIRQLGFGSVQLYVARTT